MILRFSKYHGTGNDFIIIDNRNKIFSEDQKLIHSLCHRQFGIGADGLMVVSNHESFDFSMKYYNSDGNEGSMCGNGGRCIAAYYHKNISKKNVIQFEAVDGTHHAEIIAIDKNITHVQLQLHKVEKVERNNSDFLLNTGSPHLVKFVDSVDSIDVKITGRDIRYNSHFAPDGINVNFVEFRYDKLYVRTYERGVEDETLSCGTGVAASAIAASFIKDRSEFEIITKGGSLTVSFNKQADSFNNIWLTGPACFVYSGEIEI